MNDDEIKRAGFSRRDMMRVLAAGGMLATGATGMLAGATSAFADTPKKGGKIRAAYESSSTSDTLDPAKGSTGADYIRFFMFYSGLTQFDASLTPQPALAESFTSSDAKVWTLKLRKGVTFHDGKALAPADVVYSLMRHKNPATASKVKSVADQFDEVKASGPDEVQITLSVPECGPAGDSRHAAACHHQGRHHGLFDGRGHRTLQGEDVQAGCQHGRRAQRQLLAPG